MNFIEVHEKARNIQLIRLYLYRNIDQIYSKMFGRHYNLVTNRWNYCSDDVVFYNIDTFAVANLKEIDSLNRMGDGYFNVDCDMFTRGLITKTRAFINDTIIHGKDIDHIEKLIMSKDKKFSSFVDVNISIMSPFQSVQNIKNGVVIFKSEWKKDEYADEDGELHPDDIEEDEIEDDY